MSREGNFWRNLGAISALHVVLIAGLLRTNGGVKKSSQAKIAWLDTTVLPDPAALGESSGGSPTPAISDKTPEADREKQDDQRVSPPLLEERIAHADPAIAPGGAASALTDVPRQPKPGSPSVDAPAPKRLFQPRLPAWRPELKHEPSAKRAAVHSPLRQSRPKREEGEPKPPLQIKEFVSGRSSAKGKPASVGNNIAAAAMTTHSAGGTTMAGSLTPSAASTRYAKMLHDRFFGEWIQPKSVAASGTQMSAIVTLKIDAAGRVSEFSVARSSGNVVIDTSIDAVAKRVTQVDPPPFVSANGHYEVNINFELKLE